MNKKLPAVFFILILLIQSGGNLYSQEFGIGVRAGTRGFGAEITRSFGSQFNLRVGAAFFSLSPDGGGSQDDFKYAANIDLSSVIILGDYFPFENAIRVTAGGIINLNAADIELVPTQSYTVGGDTYDPDNLGSLSAGVEFDTFAPYIGLGIGNPMTGQSSLQFTLDVGTMYQGTAAVNLSATGLLEPSAAPDQEQQLEDNLSWFKWYPVISFGMFYKF